MKPYVLIYQAVGDASGSVPCDTLLEAIKALIEQQKRGGMLAFEIEGVGATEEKELAYWRLCRHRAELITVEVRARVADQTISSLPLARIYYERGSYWCHRCGAHWAGKGTLRPCTHPRKSVCAACAGKCDPDGW
jgi:hypothetical protein